MLHDSQLAEGDVKRRDFADALLDHFGGLIEFLGGEEDGSELDARYRPLVKRPIYLYLGICLYEYTHTQTHTHTYIQTHSFTLTHIPVVLDAHCVDLLPVLFPCICSADIRMDTHIY